ncbi:MAG TPA: SRPBCC family protein [Marmoricola sp.]
MSAPTPLPISASTVIDATPHEVWAVVSDVTRMPEFSPELRKVITLGKTRGLGQNILGINRRKAVAWPTTSKVVRWEPGRAVAWKTRESGATWSYEITPADTGVRLTATRELDAFTLGSKLMTPILGGAIGHDEELAAGLATTLDRIKAVVER